MAAAPSLMTRQVRAPIVFAARGARLRRLALARALSGADSVRSFLVEELAGVRAIAGADRAAIVWADLHGPAGPCPFVVLDLGSDLPRRSFRAEMLAAAMEVGIPGVLDLRGRGTAQGPSFVVALGVDEVSRAWFVVADGRTPRPRLTREERCGILHLAGRCSAAVLHRDLDPPGAVVGTSTWTPHVRFTGWAILDDIGSHRLSKRDEEALARRFLVGRLVGLVVERGGTFPTDLSDRVATTRDEIERLRHRHPERSAWDGVLRALEERNGVGVCEATLGLARRAADAGHWKGCAQLGSWAFDLAAAWADAPLAAASATVIEMACRKLSDGAAATRWAQVGRAVQAAMAGEDVGPIRSD